MKRLIGTIFALLVLVAWMPPAATAHQGDPNFRSEILGIEPASLGDGIQMSVKNFDDSIELINRSGRTVMVMGYDGEPYLRFDPDGLVEVNVNSPSHYLNEERYADVALPAQADSAADPDWQEVDTTGVYLWHDHRSHYMAAGAPVQVTDPTVETRIFDYAIPMAIDGEPARAKGSLTWVGTNSGFPLAPFIALVVIVAGGTAFIVLRRSRRDPEAEDA
jgi:hypothetical protein